MFEHSVLSERERSFRWRDGERLVRFGAGAASEAPELLGEEGFEGYVLLTTPRALGSSIGKRLAGGAATVLEIPHGRVPEAAAAVRGEVRGRPLVALGGGRVIDSAKAVAATDGLRCAAVPTTLSGAELTRIHRLPTGAERPRAGLVRPALVAADPDLMASQAPAALAASAINALAHGAEALYAVGANPVSELAALRGSELIAAGLEPAEPAREPLALVSLLCAYALEGAGLSLHHVVCQTIVAVCGTPHAQTNSVVLPRVLAWVAPHAPRELGRLAAALGAGSADPALAAERVRGLAERAGVARLSDLGVERNDLGAVVDAAQRRPELASTPGSPGRDALRELLAAAL